MFRLLKEFAIIAVITLIGAGFSVVSGLSSYPWAIPEVVIEPGEILPVDAKVTDAIWIDGRPLTEFETDHIPGAIWLNEDNWENQFLNFLEIWLETPKPVIVYCGSESCGTSKRIAARLRENLPDAEIYSLKGGWDAWNK